VADRTTREPTRRTLLFLIVPMIGFYAIAIVGDALAPRLVDTHPLLLIAMNARNRNLILVTNQLDAVSYYSVGFLRLLASDPVFFLLGYFYGDAALNWMEKRTRTFGGQLRQWEHWFRRASYVFVFAAPNNFICVFAGAAGMGLTGFFIANITGTIVRLYVLRRLGDVFEAPIDDLLDFIKDHRGPLLVASIVLVVVMTLLEYRKGDGEISAILHLEDELVADDEPAAADGDDGPRPAAEAVGRADGAEPGEPAERGP
jgi:membrane protein DedA with SNARE-associated domain